MAQASVDMFAVMHGLEEAGFEAEKAEAMVRAMNQIAGANMQMAQDIADLKSHIYEDLATKVDIRGMVTKDDIRDMVVKDDIRDMVVKDDIRDMVTKDYLSQALSNTATKDDIRDMVVKDDIRDMVVKDDIRDMVTKDYLSQALSNMTTKDDMSKLYRRFAFWQLGAISIIIGVIKYL